MSTAGCWQSLQSLSPGEQAELTVLLKAIPLMQAAEMGNSPCCSLCFVLGLSRELSPPKPLLQHRLQHHTRSTLPKPSFGISLPRANHKGKQSPRAKCAPYRLTIREHSSNSCHQDDKQDMVLCMSSWLVAIPANRPALYEVKPSADRPGTSTMLLTSTSVPEF